jgi:hypothetical protein
MALKLYASAAEGFFKCVWFEYTYPIGTRKSRKTPNAGTESAQKRGTVRWRLDHACLPLPLSTPLVTLQ